MLKCREEIAFWHAGEVPTFRCCVGVSWFLGVCFSLIPVGVILNLIKFKFCQLLKGFDFELWTAWFILVANSEKILIWSYRPLDSFQWSRIKYTDFAVKFRDVNSLSSSLKVQHLNWIHSYLKESTTCMGVGKFYLRFREQRLQHFPRGFTLPKKRFFEFDMCEHII